VLFLYTLEKYKTVPFLAEYTEEKLKSKPTLAGYIGTSTLTETQLKMNNLGLLSLSA
jgi:hypothetical protein